MVEVGFKVLGSSNYRRVMAGKGAALIILGIQKGVIKLGK